LPDRFHERSAFVVTVAAWLDFLKQNLESSLTVQLALPDRLFIAINTMCLKNILCQIYSNLFNLHGEPLLPFHWLITTPVWHFDAVLGEEESIPLL